MSIFSISSCQKMVFVGRKYNHIFSIRQIEGIKLKAKNRKTVEKLRK